jgi:hypothetical protein
VEGVVWVVDPWYGGAGGCLLSQQAELKGPRVLFFRRTADAKPVVRKMK